MKRTGFPTAAVFVIGLLLGAAAGVRYEKRSMHQFWQHGPNTSRMLADLSRRLGLTSEQQEKLRAILNSNRGQVTELHEQMLSQFEGIRTSFRQNLGSILTPDQQKKFAAMTAQWDARRLSMTANAATPIQSNGQNQ
ncbi:MAG TPA: hypothetical protein VNK24_05370 [Elusimicrobiota bacterium]|nr:hypothetical protein [Elusimicrobiota bacterium]